jgi:hypothetical protein
MELGSSDAHLSFLGRIQAVNLACCSAGFHRQLDIIHIENHGFTGTANEA